jgi:O-antigen ligase
VVSLLVVALSAIDFDRFTSVARSVSLFIAIAAVAYLGSTHANPVTNRFVTGDIVRVHGLGINANGREAIWETTWESARRAPLTGHGAGSADDLVARRFQPAAVHVHNDYLRLFHDYGVIGVGLWALSFAQMFRKSGLRKSERRASLTRDGSIFSVAAQLGLLGLSLAMLTDNPLLYSFVVTPVGLLVGAAMGLRQLPARLPAATSVGGAP